MLLCLAGSFLGGCTSLLASRGDPDLSILRRGAGRADIEKEIGHPKVIQHVEEGRYIALYIVRLGAPRNPDAQGESLTNVGKGVGASIASGAFGRVVNSLAATGKWSGKTSRNAAAAAAVGLAVWGVSELAGTVRELSRLARRRKHQLEVVYDDRHRMLTHQLLPLAGGRLPENAALVLADRTARAGPDPHRQLR